MKYISKKLLFYLFIVSLIIRLSYSFYFQQFYFGEFVFKYKDTASYLNPILNFINHGIYMGDLYVEDSKYFRVPVYPAFLGLNYLIFGSKYFYYVVAFLQSIIDSFSTILVFLIIRKITSSFSMSLISGIIYATYPFIILWNPINYPEVIYIFLMWLTVYISTLKLNLKLAFLQGIIIGLALLTKQYMGLLLIIPFLSILLNNAIKNKIMLFSIVIIGFLLILSPWVIRNYMQSNRLIVLMGDTPGLRIYGKDFRAFEKFAQLFNKNITYIMYDVVNTGRVHLNKHKDFLNKHDKEIQEAMKKAHDCGPSFVQRRINYKDKPQYNGCEKEVIEMFNKLENRFWDEVPFWEAIDTRLDSVKKIFFKSDIINKNIKLSKADLVKKGLFLYRTVLIFLGLLGVFILLYKNISRNIVLSMIIVAISGYIYFAVIIIHVEIRYLLFSDLLISIFASIPIVTIHKTLKR